MAIKNCSVRQSMLAVVTLTFGLSLTLAGCGGGASPAQDLAAVGGIAAGGTSGNTTCAAVEEAYSSFLNSYTPANGGNWDGLAAALATTINSDNETSELATDVFGLSQDAAGYASIASQGGGNSVNGSGLQEFDGDLQAVGEDCGITLTSPQPGPDAS